MISKNPPGIVGLVHGPPEVCSQVQRGPSTVKPKEEKTKTPQWRPTTGTPAPQKTTVECRLDSDDEITVDGQAGATV